MAPPYLQELTCMMTRIQGRPMSEPNRKRRHPFALASLLALIACVFLAIPTPTTTHSATAAREAPPVRFMRQAANALINAQRQNSVSSFQRVIAKYGHMPAIGLYALGNYRSGLHRKYRPKYYRGLAKFIARYAAQESPKYPVSRVTFAPAAINDGRSIMVDSRVYLTSGSTYDVRWLLIRQGRSYKVRDAQVLGFWVSPFLQNLFESYIRKHNGRVNALVVALNNQ